MAADPAFILPADAHMMVRRAYDYWLSIHRPDGGLPGRQHFDPTAIPKLLPHVWLVDVEAQPLHLRYRLLGNEIRRVSGRDDSAIGRSFNDFDPDFAPGNARYESFAAVIRDRQPEYRRGAPRFPPGLDHLSIERILMPLAADGSTVDMLFCLSVFLPRQLTGETQET